MLDYSRFVKKKLSNRVRILLLALPVLYIVLTLSQAALAKNTYLINDGGHVTLHSTYATDPEAVLQEIGVQLQENDIVTTQPGNGLSEITVQRRQAITLHNGETVLQLTSYGETVSQLISRNNLFLTASDILSVSPDTATFDGMEIFVYKAVEKTEVYTISIPFQTNYCYDDTLPKDEQVVLTEGHDGKLLCTDIVYLLDGKEIRREVSSQIISSAPVDCMIAIGTYVETTEPIPMPTEPAPTEPAPTEPAKPVIPPVSQGMPTIDGNTITTSDGTVLTFSSALEVVATAYCRTDVGGEITFLGTPTRVGAIAVDPKVIPLGTKMYIVSNDGKYIYGEAVAEDIGGSIKGNRIDLFYETEPECNMFGVRGCTVYILS